MEFIRNYFSCYLYLSEEATQLISRSIVKMSIKRGTLIVCEGKCNPYVYIIKHGVVRGYQHINGEEVTTTLWMENETFGDVRAFITNMPATKSYEALEDLIVYRIDSKEFRSYYALSLEVCNLGRLILEDYILHRASIKDTISLLNTEQRYNFFLLQRKGLINRVKLKYIASYLDIAPETLSRIRKKCLEMIC